VGMTRNEATTDLNLKRAARPNTNPNHLLVVFVVV